MTIQGCGNHGCIIQKPIGMGTNGRCNCLRGLEKKMESQVVRKIRNMQKVIDAQSKLLACYRIGSQPPEWVFNDLETARQAGIEF